MTRHAERNTVRDLVPAIGMRGPRQNVMRLNINAACLAILTGVVVTTKYGGAPLLVLIAPHLIIALAPIALVAWMRYTLLEVRSAAPCGRRRATFDTSVDARSFSWVLPCCADLLSAAFASLFRCIRTLPTAVQSGGGAGRYTELFSASQASAYNRRIEAFEGAVLAALVLNPRRYGHKTLAASLTCDLDPSAATGGADLITTGGRAGFPATMIQAASLYLKRLAADLACCLNLRHRVASKSVSNGIIIA